MLWCLRVPTITFRGMSTWCLDVADSDLPVGPAVDDSWPGDAGAVVVEGARLGEERFLTVRSRVD